MLAVHVLHFVEAGKLLIHLSSANGDTSLVPAGCPKSCQFEVSNVLESDKLHGGTTCKILWEQLVTASESLSNRESQHMIIARGLPVSRQGNAGRTEMR